MKLPSKCNVIDGSIQRYRIILSFVLDKPPGYKVFCQPAIIYFKKRNRPLSNNMTFFLEDDNPNEADFIEKTLTFTLQLVKRKFF